MPGWELFGDEEKNAITELFDLNGGVMFAHGFPAQRKNIFRVREFEAAVSAYSGAAYCQAVSSGTAALLVGLKALGIGPRDEVITSSFTFVATVEAIIAAGAVPVLTEIDDSFTMDPDDLVRRITSRTKAVIPVHMAGASCDMDRIMAVADRHGLLVLEDAAQHFGGRYKGRMVGTIGHAGICSFDFQKTVTTGEGGLVLTNDAAVFERARAFHDHGHEYNPTVPRGRDTRSAGGFNYRMTEFQAAIGLVQLAKAETVLSAQRQNRDRIVAGLAPLGLAFRRFTSDDPDGGDTIIFLLENETRALAFAAVLAEQGVGTKNLPDAIDWHFAGTWDHMLADYGLTPCSRQWPVTDALLRRAIALPVMVRMSDSDLARVISGVHVAVAAHAVV